MRSGGSEGAWSMETPAKKRMARSGETAEMAHPTPIMSAVTSEVCPGWRRCARPVAMGKVAKKPMDPMQAQR